MIQTKKGPFRADHVGSFLRPARLKQAREQFARGIFQQEIYEKLKMRKSKNLSPNNKKLD